MDWSEERTSTLKKLWLEGLSASQIAKQLGGVTRNSVIGKVHRLGLTGRAVPSQPTRPAFKAPRPARPVSGASPRRVTAKEPEVPLPDAKELPALEREEEPGSATTLTLGAHMCKWPIGDPNMDGFTFCGRRSSDGGPYCSEHARVAYRPKGATKKTKVSEGIA